MRSGRSPVRISIASAFIGFACGSEADGPREDCDPLAAVEQPIALRDVIAVGEASDGTIYLVDEDPADAEEHAFISKGDELRRVRIAGSGTGTDHGVRSYYLELEAASGRLALGVVIDGGETRMAVAPGEDFDRGDIFEAIVDAGEELRVLEESAVDGMKLRNLRGDVYVEYWAETDDDTQIVVVRPEDDWVYEHFRLFYGMPNQMRERTVVEVLRGRDGGTTNIRFVVDGVEYEAHFGVNLAIPDDADTYLDVGDKRIDLVRREPTPDALAELTFACLPQAR